MRPFKSLDALAKHLQKKINKAEQKEVYEAVREVMAESIQREVYDAYSPITYERRGTDGGLGDPESIIGSVADDGTLEVRNTALPNDSLQEPPTPYRQPYDSAFAGWIDRGEVPNIFGAQDGAWLHPRPFNEETIEKLQNNPETIRTALKEGMARQDIKLE